MALAEWAEAAETRVQPAVQTLLQSPQPVTTSTVSAALTAQDLTPPSLPQLTTIATTINVARQAPQIAAAVAPTLNLPVAQVQPVVTQVLTSGQPLT